MFAGTPVDDRLVLGLAGKLRDADLGDAAEKLENGYDRETKILALSNRSEHEARAADALERELAPSLGGIP